MEIIKEYTLMKLTDSSQSLSSLFEKSNEIDENNQKLFFPCKINQTKKQKKWIYNIWNDVWVITTDITWH